MDQSGETFELVLDSWPVMEWIQGKQPARAKFAVMLNFIEQGKMSFSMSRINFGEVIYGIHKIPNWPEEKRLEGLRIFRTVSIDIISVTDQLVDDAVDLKSRYKISYADAFAAALSIERNSPLVTGDKEFRALEADGLLQLHWLGE